MAEQSKRNFKAIASDIAEGFVTASPLYLKPFDEDGLKLLIREITIRQNGIRSEPFPYNNIDRIRRRNISLQRLYNALSIIKNQAKEKKFKL